MKGRASIAALAAALATGALAAGSGAAHATYLDGDRAVLRWQDKVTARVTGVEVPVGESARVATLEIAVHTCQYRPPEEPPESAAFLEIWETPPGEERRQVFSGWMFASSPALSAMEHPVYDVWVASCESTESTASPESGPSE